jgi:hypothetical protein
MYEKNISEFIYLITIGRVSKKKIKCFLSKLRGLFNIFFGFVKIFNLTQNEKIILLAMLTVFRVTTSCKKLQKTKATSSKKAAKDSDGMVLFRNH